jgi:anti-sigma regulatory factor (Ser/Thr protein kinase)
VNIRTEDEIGELASAFNRVQATAALLMEQQIVTRRNVAVMFANVARRTRGLVSRQMSWIDDLEHDERDAARLGKLYQLDHVTMRLRRSAASLLVIAGSRNEEAVSSVATLPDIVRSAVAEIEGYQNVHIGQVDAVAINSSLVADLTLLLAEVLENATSFSPPQVLVTVDAQVYAEGCLIRVVDQGIGMTAARMAEENERIEMRERLDVMPTAVLGLFVVGRIARRHGMSVQLRPTAGTGVTVDITVPRSLLQAVPMAQPVIPAMPVAAAAPVIDARERFEGRARVRPPAEPQPVGESRGGLRRRERPGDAPAVPEPIAARGPVVRDPEAERAGLNAFERQFARGAQQQSEFAARYASGGQSGVQMHNATRADAGMTPGGLRRRRPGEHLAAELRELSPSDRRRPDLRPDYRLPARDAEAERAALADYSAGLARAPRHNAIRSDFDWSRG